MKRILIGVLIVLSGCAGQSERYFTVEQDARAREICGPVGGCAVVPRPVWEAIEELLKELGLIPKEDKV